MNLSGVRRILVPVDFSAHSNEALSWAADLARRVGARLTLLHVHEPIVFTSDEGAALLDGDADQTATAAEQAALDEARRDLDPIAVDTEFRVGGAASEILRVTRDGAFDLVVMGTHGRTGLSRVLLGSVAQKVVRRAPCPVLTVRVPAAARPAVPAHQGAAGAGA